jgi:hypothetical protein
MLEACGGSQGEAWTTPYSESKSRTWVKDRVLLNAKEESGINSTREGGGESTQYICPQKTRWSFISCDGPDNSSNRNPHSQGQHLC